MQEFCVGLEVVQLDEAATGETLQRLAEWGVVVGDTDHATSLVEVTVPAPSLAAAVQSAAALLGGEVLGVQAMPAAVRDARHGWGVVPDEFYSTTEAAQVLGVSRQAVRELCERGTLPARRVGTVLVLDRGAVDARAAQRA